MSLLTDLISLVNESLTPEATSRTPPIGSILLDTRNFDKADPVDPHAGASFVETTRIITKKINANHRVLAKRAVVIFESWPQVEDRIEKEKYSMYLMREEIKAFPRILRAVASIQESVRKIMDRTVALEELLTTLEATDLANRQDRWKRQQNSEVREYHRKVQLRLNQLSFETESELAGRRRAVGQARSQLRQEEARSSLFRMKLSNVRKDVEEKNAYFASEEYLGLVREREERRERRVFDEAFHRDVAEYLKDPDYLKPKFPRSDEQVGGEGEVAVESTRELETFLEEEEGGEGQGDEEMVQLEGQAGGERVVREEREESDDEEDLPKYEVMKEEAVPGEAEM